MYLAGDYALTAYIEESLQRLVTRLSKDCIDFELNSCVNKTKDVCHDGHRFPYAITPLRWRTMHVDFEYQDESIIIIIIDR